MIKDIYVALLGLLVLTGCDSTGRGVALNEEYNQGARIAARDLVHGNYNIVTHDIENAENIYVIDEPREKDASFYDLLKSKYGIDLVEKATWSISQCRGYNMVSEAAMRERFGYTFYEDSLDEYSGGATVYRLVE